MTARGARMTSPLPVTHMGALAAAHSPGFHLAMLAVFLSPMNHFRLDAVYITASDVAVVVALVVMLWQGALPRRPFGGATGLWIAGFLMLGTGLMLGSIAHAAGVELGKVMAQYAFSLLLVPLVVAGRSLDETVALARVLVLSIVVVMLFGMWMIHFVPDPPLRFVSYNNRMRSLVERENECAALGAVAVVFLLGLWQAGFARLWELLVALPILAYGIMLTGSNTGLMCAALGVGMIMVFAPSGRLTLFVLVVAGSILALGFAFPALVPDVFRSRVLEGIAAADPALSGTFADRMLLIQEAFRLADDRLLIGMGAEQFRNISVFDAPVHNTYLLLLNEGGLLSLCGLVALMLAGLPAPLSHLPFRRYRGIAATTLTILLIFALMLNTFPHFYARFWNVPLILALSLSCALPQARAPRPSRSAVHA